VLLEIIRSLFVRRCPAVVDLNTPGWGPVHCDRPRRHGGQHVADRGMDEIRWTEQLQ
jgi:hypothetical protein